jgi:hypothetical protein
MSKSDNKLKLVNKSYALLEWYNAIYADQMAGSYLQIQQLHHIKGHIMANVKFPEHCEVCIMQKETTL